MSKYVRIAGGIATEVIPFEDPIFPGIVIADRYSAEFLSSCVEIEDSVEVYSGYTYDAEAKTFSAPVVVVMPDKDDPNYMTTPSTPTLADRVEELETTMMSMMLGI